jgi:hypothetical protein
MGMKYIVKSVSIFDNSVMMWEFDNEQEAKTKVRELKDTGSNYFLVKIYQSITEQV